MRRRGSLRLITLGALAAASVAVPVGFSGAKVISTANENAHTVIISLPGPFDGCTFLNAAPGSSSDAILDLVRPSAFQTTPAGGLAGEGGAISSAELTSLQPETVRYTLAANLHWSNGATLSGIDLVTWWQRAKHMASVLSDGYRAIKSLTVSSDGLTVTAVFGTNYADWSLLFRDVEERGVSGGCGIAKLVRDPSLGPYEVRSATPSRVVLTMNHAWPGSPNRFGRVIITTNPIPPTSARAVFAGYSLDVSRSYVQSLSSYPTLSSRIGSSARVEELAFAPKGRSTRRILVRKALSWSLNRQAMINTLWGSVTFLPSVAQSALFSQAQNAYPGGGGTGPVGQTTTTTTPTAATNGLNDCFSCAVEALKSAGYVHRASRWFDASGAPLSVALATGPSALDRAIGRLALDAWRHLGVVASIVVEPSEDAAAVAVAQNVVDASIFARSTSTAPSTTARSWSGPQYFDSFPSGVRMARVNVLFNQAVGIFNPVTADVTWLTMDRVLLNAYWVRPLFTAPTVQSWTGTLSNVVGSFLTTGFVDEVLNWSITPLTPQN